MKEKIATVTYSNSKCEDVLNIHLSQLDSFSRKFESYVFFDREVENKGRHKFIQYKNEDPYYLQYLTCLERVEEEYIIYLQEDFFSCGYPNYEELYRCQEFLDRTSFSFVRLVRTELAASIHNQNIPFKRFDEKTLEENIYDAFCTDPSSFSFQMQATLWKKKDIANLYDYVKSRLWLESRDWDAGMRNLAMEGSYYYSRSPKEGKYHWKPEIWPHICTAVGKGMWNMSQHGDSLEKILREHKVNISTRGTR